MKKNIAIALLGGSLFFLGTGCQGQKTTFDKPQSLPGTTTSAAPGQTAPAAPDAPAQQVTSFEYDASPEDKAKMDQGLAFMQQKKGQEAYSLFDSLLKQKPEAAESYKSLADGLLNNGRALDSMLIFGILAQNFPDNSDYVLDLGKAATVAGRPQDSVSIYSLALEKTPTNASLYEARGKSQELLTGQDEAALADYNRAIELKPDFDLAYLSRATLQIKMGQNEAAATDLDKVIGNNRSPELVEQATKLKEEMTAGASAK